METESMRLSWGSGKICSVRTVIYKHYCINEIFWECENIKSVKNDKDYLSKRLFRNLYKEATSVLNKISYILKLSTSINHIIARAYT